MNNEFTTRQADGRADTRVLTSPAELLTVLAENFGLHFPPTTHFTQAWAAALPPPPA